MMMIILIITILMRIHGQYIRDIDENIDKEKSGECLKNGDLKACTEALICVVQEQTIHKLTYC